MGKRDWYSQKIFSNRGFSLIEALLLLGVVGVVAGVIPPLMTSHVQGPVAVDRKVKAVLLAESYLENFLASQYLAEPKITFDNDGNPQYDAQTYYDEAGTPYSYQTPADPAKYPDGYQLEVTVRPDMPIANITQFEFKVTWSENNDPRAVVLSTFRGSNL